MKQFENLKVLIVEDHQFQRKAMVHMMSKLNVAYIEAVCDGKQAISLIDVIDFDIIICDLMMPHLDGLGVLRDLSKRHYTGSIIISSAMDSSLFRAVKNLASEYELRLLGTIAKPVTINALSELCEAHFSQQLVHHQTHRAYSISVDDIVNGIYEGQFFPYFQPQVNFHDGSLYGVEALIRWQHPQYGVLTPRYFLAQVEEAGLTLELTETIFEQSVNQLNQLPAPFDKSRLSVNLSATCVSNDSLEQFLLALNEQPFRRSITLEVTEDSVITQPGKALENLTRLRMNGFELAIDDFGTGYSSMKQLSFFPFNEFKLDRSFVSNCIEDENNRIIVESSMHLARTLELTTIAEGVETFQQWQFLKSLSCDVCQGYLVAKPMPQGQLVAWHQKWQQFYKTQIEQSGGHAYVS